MSERICETCEKIDFGIWGTLGAIGYSLIIGCMGYTFSLVYFDLIFVWVLVVIGVILWIPMFLIATKAEREMNEQND